MINIPGMPISQSRGSMKKGASVPAVGTSAPDSKNNGATAVKVANNEAK
jgi:hypothetical protein